jgi:hypothetical protein
MMADDDNDIDVIAHADMVRAIEIARLVNDTRRRPARSRLDTAQALMLYAASLADDLDETSRCSFRMKLLQLANQLRPLVQQS